MAGRLTLTEQIVVRVYEEKPNYKVMPPLDGQVTALGTKNILAGVFN
jgi:hypothetical protein